MPTGRQRGVYNYLPVDDVMSCGCAYRKTAWSVYLPVVDVVIVIVYTRRQLSVHLCSFFLFFSSSFFFFFFFFSDVTVCGCVYRRTAWSASLPSLTTPMKRCCADSSPTGPRECFPCSSSRGWIVPSILKTST